VDASEKPPPAKKKRGSYTNWFVPDLWPFIEQAVKQHPKACMKLCFPFNTSESLAGLAALLTT